MRLAGCHHAHTFMVHYLYLYPDVVRSLSLPGSYGDKITHLGRSLLAFTHLKHLDLSRNAIESLQGLDHLKQLETLNLYPTAGH